MSSLRNSQMIAPRAHDRLDEYPDKLEDYWVRPADQALYNELLKFRFPPKSGQTDVNLAHELVPLNYAEEKRWSVTGEIYPPNQLLDTMPSVHRTVAPMPPSASMLDDYTTHGTTASVDDRPQLAQFSEPCTECSYFECPNAAGGEYDGCPYATVYEVSARYDPYAGYGYEHLPRSSNPRGWTFENTGGCRLYALGLKTLAPRSEA
ncbi:hypothetical protein DFH08DRAFT_1007902 [Mycena albidolilacea]|uniref:Uncharacterized protein n=1 Tax=Mycena albidolilacea TaxID=1033008 RepID=A0AAD7ERF9_9AGAR|nr:hypothetical protein DFH08DRAFT_1007902 [Mycena albidolilacea]